MSMNIVINVSWSVCLSPTLSKMKTFLVLCFILSLAVAVSPVSAQLNVDYHDNHTSLIMSEKTQNQSPCMKNPDNNAYNKFKNVHVLDSSFSFVDKTEWSKYLDRKQLCGSVPVQSFFQKVDEGKVKSVCQGQGFVHRQNICVSQESFMVFHVTSQAGEPCKVTEVVSKEQKVMLACDTIAEVNCLPVHYEKYSGQQPRNEKCQKMQANASPAVQENQFLDMIKIASIIFVLV